jgi:AraC-like DNA-binding protein
MNYNTAIPDKSISLFVKNIMVFEEADIKQKTILPFFADGYPGLIFQETSNGLLVRPQNKVMPVMFLYGQTINPIELVMTGSYKLIVFQLYPFVLKSFFNVIPQELNDNCYNLEQLHKNTIAQIKQIKNHTKRIEIITSKAIQKIITKKGQLLIGDLCKELHLTERTFERRFINAVGVTAKQFSKIIQFHQSLEQLTVKDFTKLTDIVYANGFADQSHFIKVFKAFTGKTPLAFTLQK